VLPFERQVVASLVDGGSDEHRAAVERWVEASLADMPEHLRAGVIAESLALAAAARLARRSPESTVALLDSSPIGLLRQYVRLFRSLVLFAENELSNGTAEPSERATTA
jgi:hypothetical protein